MKSAIKKSIVFASVFYAANLFAQEQTILDHFTVSELNGKLVLNWQITSGKTCNGIQIYRSVNNTEFVQVGEIDGICGSVTRPINYVFNDDNPVKNQLNSYRLELGGYGNSETVSAEIIDVDAKTFQLRPNPISTSAKLLFSNPKKQEATISILSLGGILLNSFATKNNITTINAEGLKQGIYFFNITIENQLITSGKFIVQ